MWPELVDQCRLNLRLSRHSKMLMVLRAWRHAVAELDDVRLVACRDEKHLLASTSL